MVQCTSECNAHSTLHAIEGEGPTGKVLQAVSEGVFTFRPERIAPTLPAKSPDAGQDLELLQFVFGVSTFCCCLPRVGPKVGLCFLLFPCHGWQH